MIIVRILKVVGYLLLNGMLSTTIAFSAVLLLSYFVVLARGGREPSDSYYDGVKRSIFWIALAAMILLCIFGPFRLGE